MGERPSTILFALWTLGFLGMLLGALLADQCGLKWPAAIGFGGAVAAFVAFLASISRGGRL